MLLDTNWVLGVDLEASRRPLSQYENSYPTIKFHISENSISVPQKYRIALQSQCTKLLPAKLLPYAFSTHKAFPCLGYMGIHLQRYPIGVK